MATTTFTRPASVDAHKRSLGAVVVLAVLVLFAGAAYGLHVLQTMSDEMNRMSTRLAVLQSMDAKLNRLARMEATLERMDVRLTLTNRQLASTNGSLAATNATLARTNGALARMQDDIARLGSIRSDIHQMAHKIEGSFLFRGVK